MHNLFNFDLNSWSSMVLIEQLFVERWCGLARVRSDDLSNTVVECRQHVVRLIVCSVPR